jgi:LmbE family N-acetylglucosaminyl deacetylase
MAPKKTLARSRRGMAAVRIDELGRGARRVLCLGAHPDDIEIGCGGTIAKLARESRQMTFHWVVFSGEPAREREALQSANALLAGVKDKTIVVHKFRDGFLPTRAGEVKDCFEQLKREFTPDLVLTHYRDDRHQDHRLISELTWNTFRNHLILEYEIPKWDGDFGTPNVFVPLSEAECRGKIRHILEFFKTQAEKPWFSEELFRSVLRIRGMESNASGRYAEAFYARKLSLQLGAHDRDTEE